MEGKRGRGKLRIMMLYDIKSDETHEKIEPWIENVGETGCIEPAFKQNTNHDDDAQNLFYCFYFRKFVAKP